MNKLFIVAKYEYLQTVKNPVFWLTMLFLPIFMGVVMGVSGYSSMKGEETFNNKSKEVENVYIFDETGVVEQSFLDNYYPGFKLTDNMDEYISKVQSGEINGFIHYPKTVVTDGKIDIFKKVKKSDILGDTIMDSASTNILKDAALLKVNDPNLIYLIKMNLSLNKTNFDENGKEVKIGVEQFIIPGVSAIIFFMSVFIGASFLLKSVSEEKENRMIELMLSTIKRKSLIYGKIVGLSGIVLTQLFVWIILGVVVAYFGIKQFNLNVPINISSISFELIPVNIYFTFMGFLLFAAIMVGVGSVGTNYSESSSLSSVFIILSMLPIYFSMFLITDPNGVIARIVSYFPMTAPMVLLFRNSMGTLPTYELILGAVLVFIYVIVAFWLATKMFELGAVMYNRKPTLKEIWYVLKR